jgi:hypothetical protein
VDTNALIQPGQGYVSYTVRPRTNQPSGTVITNAARIVFDWNDPIDTPPVFNTLDAAPPVSTVLPLPAESGRTFLVRWAGQDDPGGSGVASYDVYVSTDGVSYAPWLQGTNATSAYFVGELGQFYSFRCVARDRVGHEETTPLAPQAWTTVSTNSPVLAGVSEQTVFPNSRLAWTNQVSGGTGGSFLFALGQGAPAGAEVDPTNGVFRWGPNCAQASRTNQITVWVTDAGNNNLMDAVTFQVAVGECVVPSLGRLVLQAGDSGRVPVQLISSVPLTNLSMTVGTAPGRLTNQWVEPIVPEICASALTSAATPHPRPLLDRGGEAEAYDLSLTTCSNQFLIGTQQVAWLHFTTISNQSSAFVALHLDNIVGFQADGTPVRNFAAQSGHLVIIGAEPLLEAFIGANRQPTLILYGQPARNYVVETATGVLGPWTPDQSIHLTDTLWTPLTLPANRPQQFYRAKREGP